MKMLERLTSACKSWLWIFLLIPMFSDIRSESQPWWVYLQHRNNQRLKSRIFSSSLLFFGTPEIQLLTISPCERMKARDREVWGEKHHTFTLCFGLNLDLASYGIQELDHKEGWAPKNSCFPIVMLQKTLESARRSNIAILKEFWVNSEGNQPWIFIGRTDAEAPILWPCDVKSGCCCCCCVASVVSDSVRPYRRQPTRLRSLWDSPGKNSWVGCHFLLQVWRGISLENTLMLGKIEGKGEEGGRGWDR